MLQNEGFQLISKYFHLGRRKFRNFNGLKWQCCRMKDFNLFHQNIFTMVEENFWISMVSNAPEWEISIYFIKIFSPWLKKILEFQWSQRLQYEGLLKYFRHGWRKFRISMVSIAPEWRISIFFIKIFSPKLCYFKWSQMLQNEGFQLILQKYFIKSVKCTDTNIANL